MAQPEHIEVECLTDESGTAYAVSFYVGKHKVYSKWTRLASAEKLARTLRNAFVEGPPMDPEAARTAGVKERPLGCVLAMRVMQSDLYSQLDDAERADCDELVHRNLEWLKGDRTAGVAAAPAPQQIDESKLPPRPAGSNDANTDPSSPLKRYGRAKPESGVLLEPMDDGYWTPWHIANEMLRDAQRNAGVAAAPAGWIKMSERRPERGQLIVKRWKSNDSVWAGVYAATDKDSSFDEWFALPALGVKTVDGGQP